MTIALYVVLGILAGAFSGFFGIGGATILIPAFIYLLGLTQLQAQGTSLALMLPPIGLLAAWRYWQSGNIKMQVAIFVCLGFLLGGWLGAEFAHHIPGPALKKLFGLFLLALSMRMIFGK